jgi:hypothetical protein
MILFLLTDKQLGVELSKRYKLKQIKDNYYKNNNISLLICETKQTGIVRTIINSIYSYNIDLSKYIIINIGTCRSSLLKNNDLVIVNESYSNGINKKDNNKTKLATIDTIFKVKCCSMDSDINIPNDNTHVVYDDELNIITCFPYKKLFSLKFVSNNSKNNILSLPSNKLKEFFITIDNIIWEEK